MNAHPAIHHPRVLIVAILVLIGTFGCKRAKDAAGTRRTPIQVESRPFAEVRSQYPTQLRWRAPSPQPFENEQPPTGAKRCTYTSGNLQLQAWISNTGGSRRPAVVWCHGGFAFGADDWNECKPFRDAGFVVMTPMLRGENGNPGNYELFYGEVDDAIAAGRYLASLPNVDPSHIYIAGHSAGATVALLASLLPSPFKAAAPVGGYVDIGNLLSYWEKDRPVPFDPNDQRELRVRSACYFPGSIQCPLRLFCGEEDTIARYGAAEFAEQARQAGKSCDVVVLPGDHFTSEATAIQQAAEFFKSQQ